METKTVTVTRNGKSFPSHRPTRYLLSKYPAGETRTLRLPGSNVTRQELEAIKKVFKHFAPDARSASAAQRECLLYLEMEMRQQKRSAA